MVLVLLSPVELVFTFIKLELVFLLAPTMLALVALATLLLSTPALTQHTSVLPYPSVVQKN